MSNQIQRDEPKDSKTCREKYSQDWGISFSWLEGYNLGMAAWLSGIYLDRPEEPYQVPVMYQTPERAFADKIRPRINDQTALPIISFVETGTTFDNERYVSPPSLIYSRRKVGKKWQLEPKPMPWIINYNVTVWTKYKEDMDRIHYYLMSRFTPESYIVAYNSPAKIIVQSHSDTSDYESTDGDRVLRNDFQFDVLAWMQLPYRETGRIEGITLNLTGDIYEEINSSADKEVDVVEGNFDLDVIVESAKKV